jgi:predicted dehydrogenase
MSAPRIAVIGCGYMGSLHAAKVAALAAEGAVRFAGAADLDLARAEQAAEPHGAPATVNHRELLAHADAAVIAVPTVRHFAIVSEALDAGLDVLVEKPIAASLPEAEKLLGLARERGRVVQVGHLEWFNAAVQKVRSSIHGTRFVEAHRMGPFPGRATDVDVVRDLMIHDLDIVQRFLGEEPERIDAIGVPVLSSEIDIANARLHYPGGCQANFTASRVSPTPTRKVRFFQPDGYFSIDFIAQSVVIARRVRDPDSGERKIDLQTLEIDRGDALLSQLRSFCTAIRTREVPAGAGDEALAALRTALRVVAAMPPLALPDDDGSADRAPR